MKYLLLLTIVLSGCAAQPEKTRTMTYTHSNGRVETFTYVVPNQPAYVSNSTTTTYTDGRGAVIGYGFNSGGMK